VATAGALKVQACGICHSVALTVEGHLPGIQYPRVPGHEVVRIIDELGEGVSNWRVAQRVGVEMACADSMAQVPHVVEEISAIAATCKSPALATNGGYQQYMLAPVQALAAIPESLSSVEAAPLLCGGLTMFNSLRAHSAYPGDLVAVQGIAGLGHLGIQFANKFGYNVAAIGGGPENAVVAKGLGADIYIDSNTVLVAEELQRLAGAQVILATAPSSKSMSKLIVIGVDFEPVEVSPVQLITGARAVHGWVTGTPTDS
jgi:D-arabinose 1-dehydrogenase-like Zn-dependent alcohol dehydrogenase